MTGLEITSSLLWVAFLGVMIFYIIISWVLAYHWRKFSVGVREVNVARIIYFSISLAIIAITLWALMAYTNSL